MVIRETTEEEAFESLINPTFPNLKTAFNEPNYFMERAILSPKNIYVHALNSLLESRMPGENVEYLSIDSVEEDPQNLYQVEFLNGLNLSGFPQHKIRLKPGCPIILLRNMDKEMGLCNGT